MDKNSIQSWADLQKKKEVTRDEVVDFYDSWALTYDESVEKSASADIALAAVLSQFPDEKGRDEIKILDIAAGTGRVGMKLFENGFRQIDAIEPSQEMLNILLGLLLSSVGVIYNCRRHQLLTDVAQESVAKSHTGSGSTLIRIN